MVTLRIPKIITKKKYFFFFTVYKNEWKEHKFWRKNIFKKANFIKTKKQTKIDDIDVNKILVSRKEPYGTEKSFKYFIGYNDNVIRPYVIRTLCVRLPHMIGYARKFDENATMPFRVNNETNYKNAKSFTKST